MVKLDVWFKTTDILLLMIEISCVNLYRLVRYNYATIRKITFNWTIQKIMFFCIAVGFLLSVCCYVKLIKHLFFTLLLLFGLSFSLIYVKRAMTVKHLLTKVKAFSFRSTASCMNISQSVRLMLITSMKQLRSLKCYD